VISHIQVFDNSVTENSLFKTLGTISYLCIELVVTSNLLLNLLLKANSFMYLVSLILDVLLPKKTTQLSFLATHISALNQNKWRLLSLPRVPFFIFSVKLTRFSIDTKCFVPLATACAWFQSEIYFHGFL
jgi:hypothetical protein